MNRTTEQWWEETKADDDKFIDWLKNQYHGEVTAASRIRNLLDDYPQLSDSQRKVIGRIADDETKHAQWVRELLEARGVEAKVLDKEERYWNSALPKEPVSFEEICGVGHHAEVMRLKRIEVLANDKSIPDVAEVFSKILPDERFHAKAFEFLSSPEYIEKTRKDHESGLNSLGLVL